MLDSVSSGRTHAAPPPAPPPPPPAAAAAAASVAAVGGSAGNLLETLGQQTPAIKSALGLGTRAKPQPTVTTSSGATTTPVPQPSTTRPAPEGYWQYEVIGTNAHVNQAHDTGRGPVETKVRAQPIYSDPWTMADAATLGLDKITGNGDLDGTYQGRLTGGFDATDGRDVITQALQHTSPEFGNQVQQDEFEIIELANGKYIVNLPGVIDLSSPNIGLKDYNRSVRDLDQHAVPSSTSANVRDNAYAQTVKEYILGNVPQGADVMLVGHSYGGDTVLDLASDPTFNNKTTGVNVTHAVSAGYYSSPQLDSVVNDTKVLALMNNQDAAVNAESRNPLLPPSDKPFRVPLPGLDFGPADLGLNTGVSTRGDNIIVSRFNGGAGRDVGHHPDRYIQHLNDQRAILGTAPPAGTTTTTRQPEPRPTPTSVPQVEVEPPNPIFLDYFDSVAAAGYTGNGTTIAIDVSVPRPRLVAEVPQPTPPAGTTTATTPQSGPVTTVPGKTPDPSPGQTPTTSGPLTGTTTTTRPS